MGAMIASCLALVLLQPIETPSPSDRLGLTWTQIAAMTSAAWFDRYTARHGDSTMAMVQAQAVYGWAVERENNHAASRLSAPRKAALTALRRSAREFRFGCALCGRALSGGGTMWNLVDGGVPTAVEETIRSILRGRKSAAKGDYRVVVAGVIKRLKAPNALAGFGGTPDGLTQAAVLETAGRLDDQAESALRAAGVLGPSAVTLVRAFLLDSAKVVDAFSE